MNLASLKPAVPRFARSAVALAMAAACASAFALPEFTLDPGAAGLNTETNITADNILISDFSTVRIAADGTFTDEGFLSVSAFQLGGTTFIPTGLNSTYGMYFKFSATGTTTPGNPADVSTDGTFETLTYELFGYNGTATFGFDGANNPTETASGEVLLASGSLIAGTVSSTPDPNGPKFSPSAYAELTFAIAAGQEGVFVMPEDFYERAFAAFTNTPSQVSPFVGGFSIRQGGGAINFDMAPAIPEPETYALMLAGLAAVGFVARRRRRQD